MECKMPEPIKNMDEVKNLLQNAKTIAVVGLSPDETKDSNKVAKYLQNSGYKIVPIYPKEEKILGEQVYRSLLDVAFAIDIVNVFRKADALAKIADEAISIKAKALWAQIGCYDEIAEQKMRKAGLIVVSNHCIMIERKRIFG